VYRKIKVLLYRLAKGCGLFALSAALTSRRLRILCYHGISCDDEHLWEPGLFIAPDVLRRRFSILRKTGYPIVSLPRAIEGLRSGSLPRHATVITFDDGFHDQHALGLPIFQEFGFPVTIYVSSYYVEKQTPVFRLAVKYLFWKAGADTLDLSDLHAELAGADAQEIIGFAETKLSDVERLQLFRDIAKRLAIDPAPIEDKKLFHFMTPAEILDLAKNGVDIELHSHRHPPLEGPEQASREIADNKRVLETILGRRLEHFCYPSGVWSRALWPALEKHLMRSATTCEPGLCSRETHPYALGRYLDNGTQSEIEFEAELSGFSDLLRRLRGRRS
jgi:peptidoglycan/xylan/chitin deacetylase (PgdA/CDA1 family)